MKNLKNLLLITVFLFSLNSYSQEVSSPQRMSGEGKMPMGAGTGTLKGKIVDENDGQPVEYANIILYSLRDSSLVTGGISDKNGYFTIEKVPYGRYYVDFKFIGYNNFRMKNVMVNPRTPELILETVKLKPASEQIEGVVVTGQKSMLQHNLDKTVINVDRNINAEGGTALDIMRNIPSVEVDVEGNVSLRGSSNLTILVDGRPSQIASLDELPASIIESVEVITNPSVRYDPDGMSGILNIVLKKKKTPGYHGMVSLNAGTGDKYSGTINLNVRQGKINVFGNLDYRHFYSTGYGTSNRISDGGSQFQNEDNNNGGNSNNFRAGIDYFINNQNTLSLTGALNARTFNGKEFSTTLFNSIPLIDENSDNKNDMGGQELTLNYKRTFDKPGQEFTVDAFYSGNGRISDSKIDRTRSGILNNDISNTDGKSSSFVFQSDLVMPIGNGGRMETGVKGIIRNQDADYVFKTYLPLLNTWSDTANLSNRFIFDDQIYAGYLIYSNKVGPISYQGGVRVEDQIKKIDQRTQDKVANVSLFNYFPSAHIKWDINKVNSLQVSYSKRVNRPQGRVLNPFVSIENVYNISYGNPYLKPEYTSSYEIGHSLNFKNTNISSTLFYRNTTNKITRITTLTPGPTSAEDTLKSTFKNLTSGSTLGAEVVFSQTINNWWKVNGSFSFFKAKLDGNELVNQAASESNSWTTKFTSSFTILKGLELQVNGNYRSPVISGVGGGDRGMMGGGGGSQGKTYELYWVDLGLRYMVLKNKGTITLRASDIFNTRKFKSDTWGDGFTTYSENFRESRIIFIGFSYRINDFKQRRDKQLDNNDDSEFGNQ